MQRAVYLDHAATTPLRPGVLEAMLPYLTNAYGNPSATYELGRKAANAIESARKSVASILGCRLREIVFTGSGTESINTAIKGVAFQQRKAGAGDHIITTAIEHHAVLHSCQYLERFGFEVTYLPVDGWGLVAPEAVAAAVNERTILVSVMTANNEVGTVEPIAEVAEAARARGRALGRRIPVHTDAVQAPASLRLRVSELDADLVSLSAHKFGGPKGVGILYVGRGVPFLAQQNGGGQERQRRAGTENVAGIVGTAEALQATQADLESSAPRLRRLSEGLRDGILRTVSRSHLNGHPSRRLANNVSISFEDAGARELLRDLDAAGIACSAGAACGASTIEPSHVLLAMGLPLELAASTLRFTLGPETSEENVDYVLARLAGIVAGARQELRAAG